MNVHIANRCNLNLVAVITGQTTDLKEIFTAETLKWAEPWSKILQPERINLLGGGKTSQ